LSLVPTEHSQIQDIENFQGDNTLIRNLDLEGEDYSDGGQLNQAQLIQDDYEDE